VFKNLPPQSSVTLIPETEEIHDALHETSEILSHKWDVEVMCSLPKRDFMRTWMTCGISGTARLFDEE
jgi:hypothetical protein